MLYLKLVAVTVAISIFACARAQQSRYSVTNSKEYDASLFRQNCAICHGPEGEGKTLADGRQIPNLRDGEFKYTTDEQIYRHIADGGNGMVPFRNQFTEREMRLMVSFVKDKLRGHNRPQ
jgi:mono/diheme cytochrome c family protein